MAILPLALFGPIGTTELVIILVILLLLFGASKLPQLGGAIGKTIKGFKQEMRDGASEGADTSAQPGRNCPQCGATSPDDSSFCAKCGGPLKG
jgi:sec-independent protein translocase protein TatA